MYYYRQFPRNIVGIIRECFIFSDLAKMTANFWSEQSPKYLSFPNVISTSYKTEKKQCHFLFAVSKIKLNLTS
jgi:hypothetical protein